MGNLTDLAKLLGIDPVSLGFKLAKKGIEVPDDGNLDLNAVITRLAAEPAAPPKVEAPPPEPVKSAPPEPEPSPKLIPVEKKPATKTSPPKSMSSLPPFPPPTPPEKVYRTPTDKPPPELKDDPSPFRPTTKAPPTPPMPSASSSDATGKIELLPDWAKAKNRSAQTRQPRGRLDVEQAHKDVCNLLLKYDIDHAWEFDDHHYKRPWMLLDNNTRAYVCVRQPTGWNPWIVQIPIKSTEKFDYVVIAIYLKDLDHQTYLYTYKEARDWLSDCQSDGKTLVYKIRIKEDYLLERRLALLG